MPEIEERLRSPKIPELNDLLTKLDQSVEDGFWPAKASSALELTETDALLIIDALKWIRTSLSNRKDYHKKRQYEQKEERNMLAEALKAKGVDLEALRRRAAANVANRISDESQDEV